MEWLGIESAPMDGSDVVVFDFWNGGLFVAAYSTKFKAWFTCGDNMISPTHWIQIPETP